MTLTEACKDQAREETQGTFIHWRDYIDGLSNWELIEFLERLERDKEKTK
jgi:hypothetical protein